MNSHLTKQINTIFISLCVLSAISHTNAISYNYVTSIKVNQIELNAPVSADQGNKLVKTESTNKDMNEKIVADNIQITPQYTLQQFK